MTLHDPLLEAENTITKIKKTKIKISRAKVIFSTRPDTFGKKILRGTKFVTSYILLSGTIFGVLMGTVNYSAYSARISHWINPNAYAQSSEAISEIIENSTTQINGAAQMDSEIEHRAIIEEKIAAKNPEMVYSRSYGADNLLSNIPLASAEKASFAVNPQENRIIIPRLGKNIPLLDVDHDADTPFEEIHEVFMEELKNGIVRYPGTAKPGEAGNAFIFGHSSNYPWVKSKYNDVFALLDTLKNGDEIIVYYNQKKFVYKVTERAVVKPGDTKVLKNRDPKKKEISLMTCWPIGTTLERLIIFGELVEETSEK